MYYVVYNIQCRIEWYFGTCSFIPDLLRSAENDEYQTMKHLLLWGGIVTHTSSSKYKESRASAER